MKCQRERKQIQQLFFLEESSVIKHQPAEVDHLFLLCFNMNSDLYLACMIALRPKSGPCSYVHIWTTRLLSEEPPDSAQMRKHMTWARSYYLFVKSMRKLWRISFLCKSNNSVETPSQMTLQNSAQFAAIQWN